MDREYFDSIIGQLESRYRVGDKEKISDGEKDVYYRSFRHVENKRFYQVYEYLKDNWVPEYGVKFPYLADFYKALKATYQETFHVEPDIPEEEQVTKEDWKKFYKDLNKIGMTLDDKKNKNSPQESFEISRKKMITRNRAVRKKNEGKIFNSLKRIWE